MLTRIFYEILDVFREMKNQFIQMILFLCSPRNLLIVFTLCSTLGLAIYLFFLAMKFDYMNTVYNRAHCVLDNTSIVLLLSLGMFFGIFSLLAIGEAINIVEFKKRYHKKLPDSMVRNAIYISLFALCALISIVIILRKC